MDPRELSGEHGPERALLNQPEANADVEALASTETFNAVADGLFQAYEESRVLTDTYQFEVVETAAGFDGIVYRSSLRDSENPVAAYLVSNPQDVRPAEAVPPNARRFNLADVFATLAQNAPNLDAIRHLTAHFQRLLEATDESRPMLDQHHPGRREIAFNLLLGSMQLFDPDNVESTKTTLTQLSDVVLSVPYPADVQGLLMRTMSNMIFRGNNYVNTFHRPTGWSPRTAQGWDISNEALCATAILATETGLCDNFFTEVTIHSNRLYKDRAFLEGLHEVLLSDTLRPLFLKSFGDKPVALQNLAETHIEKILEHHLQDETRQQSKVRALLSVRHGKERSMSLPKLLQLARGRVLTGNSRDFGDRIEDFAYAGEAILSLLTLTHREAITASSEEDEDEAALQQRLETEAVRQQQFEIDALHAEIVGILGARIAELHGSSTREPLSFFELLDRFPHATDEEAKRLHQLYVEGHMVQIYGWYKSRQRAGVEHPYRMTRRIEHNPAGTIFS